MGISQKRQGHLQPSKDSGMSRRKKTRGYRIVQAILQLADPKLHRKHRNIVNIQGSFKGNHLYRTTRADQTVSAMPERLPSTLLSSIPNTHSTSSISYTHLTQTLHLAPS
jgi:hypothetical protein